MNVRCLALLPILALFAACGQQRLQRSLTEPADMATVDREAPFLKVHMADGTLYVLSPWTADETQQRVQGSGTHYGLDRRPLAEGEFTLPLQSIALFETNVTRTSPSIGALAVVTGISVAVTIACAIDPKACFGSCPTFYLEDGLLHAEGFSSSIAPHLEATDIDALARARASGRTLRLEMRNEAYETHVLRSLRLLALPRQAGTRVFHDGEGGFWSAHEPRTAAQCLGPEGDCSPALAAYDGIERKSVADSTDLAAREVLELRFDAELAQPALLLASRQSLLPTYLLYQAMAYLGSSLGGCIAAFERGATPPQFSPDALVAAIGGIEVLVPEGDAWRNVATVQETGPLASDVRSIALPAGCDRVRLRMAKGAWRVDWVALVSLRERIEPLRLDPVEVLRNGAPDPAARELLREGGQALVSFPGDRTTLAFALPQDAAQLEFFLESRGYYLEWMRREWLAEEDLAQAIAMFVTPGAALRRLAPQFHRVEAALDAEFWNSRYAGF